MVARIKIAIVAAFAACLCGPAYPQAGSTGGTVGQSDKSVSGTREAPAPRAHPRKREAAPAPKSSEVSCKLASVWANQVSDGISSVWTIAADGSATERGRGNAQGHAVMSSHRLIITWHIAVSNGNYVVQLDRNCTAGTGTTTVLGGYQAGDVKSVVFTAAQ